VGVPAIDAVHGAELSEGLPRLAEAAEDGPVKLHLVDLAGVRRGPRVVAVGRRVRDEEVLMRTRGDADRPRTADGVVDGLEIQILVPDLHARIATNTNV